MKSVSTLAGDPHVGVLLSSESVSGMCEECKHVGWGPTCRGVAVLRVCESDVKSVNTLAGDPHVGVLLSSESVSRMCEECEHIGWDQHVGVLLSSQREMDV